MVPSEPGITIFCNVGGAGDGDANHITPNHLTDVASKALLLKQNGYHGISFDIEGLKDWDTSLDDSGVPFVINALDECFQACHTEGLMVLVTLSKNGLTTDMEMVGWDQPHLTTFLKGLAALKSIDIYSPQCYVGKPPSSSYAPYPGQVDPYCSWNADTKLVLSILDEDKATFPTPAMAHPSPFNNCQGKLNAGYIVW